MLIKILTIGDTYGEPGRMAVERVVTQMKQSGQVDFVVCNAENTADGSGITEKIARELFQVGCDVLMATLGPEGSLCYSKEHGFHETPAFAYRVIDSIGAGDAFFAYVSPCFAAGMPQDLVSFIGNAVGSLAVQIVCNREPVDFVDLSKFITRLLKY